MAYVKWTFWGLIALILGAFLHYTLPKNVVVRIVESEVRRIELSQSNGLFWGSSEPRDPTSGNREVKFISSVFEGGTPFVMRNEDTGWGWPPYLKFDSSDVQARAADLISATGNPQWVQVTYYGWRSTLFSIYPNVLDMEKVASPDHRVIPWFNIIFLACLGGLILFIRWTLKRFWRRRIDPVFDRVSDSFEGAQDNAEARAQAAHKGYRGRRQRFKEWWTETFG